ncbi:hypothetical protein [Bernardetia sp.]|uniref:hypothetical protein n=1 Tax=Bernardetia sp. TaxID=1937974 RepID=UPI0025BA0DCA|nr:hypothetical protein [Bernardetia sp.]
MKNIFLFLAGILNLFTALIHTFAGQSSLISPLLSSTIEKQVQTELLAVWHMVTLFLFFTSAAFLLNFFRPKLECKAVIQFVSYLYLLFPISFIVVSLLYQSFASQWILLLPIGVLGLLGVKKYHSIPN